MNHVRWILVTIGTLIVVIAIGLISLNQIYSRQAFYEKVSKAIDAKDRQKVIALMPKELQSYPTAVATADFFLKSAEDNKKLVLQQLFEEKKDLEGLIETGFPYAVLKSGKVLFVFDKYLLVPNKTIVTIQNMDDDISLKVNGEPFQRYDLDKPFLAGNYMMEATKTSPWTNITDTLSLTAGMNSHEEMVFNLEGYRLDLSGELKGAEIIFKGVGTGIKIGDPNSNDFGPIEETDAKEIQLSADFPWGVTKSTYYDPTYFTLGSQSHFYFVPDLKAANDLFVRFANEYAQASVEQSVQPFESASERFRIQQSEAYRPSMFGFINYSLLETYFNKETPKIDIDKDGNPVMQLGGLVRFLRLKTDYLREKEYIYTLSLMALYDESSKKWSVDEANLSGLLSLPDQNKAEKYLVTKVR